MNRDNDEKKFNTTIDRLVHRPVRHQIDINAAVARICAGDNAKRGDVQEMFDHHEHGGEG